MGFGVLLVILSLMNHCIEVKGQVDLAALGFIRCMKECKEGGGEGSMSDGTSCSVRGGKMGCESECIIRCGEKFIQHQDEIPGVERKLVFFKINITLHKL